MTPRSAVAATIAASVLALAATGAVAASSSPQVGAPDKTAPPTGAEADRWVRHARQTLKELRADPADYPEQQPEG